MTTKEKPEGFNPNARVGGLIVRVGDDLLLFKRASYKKFGAGKWALCAGKLEDGEACEEGVIREAFEETGVSLFKDDLRKIDTYYHSPEIDRTFCIEWIIFEVKMDTKPQVVLNKEHDEYRWVHIDDIFSYDLIDGESFCLQDYLQH